MSISWQHADPAPALLLLPPDVASLDEAAAAIELWEHYTRKTLDSTQRLAVEVMMALGADGRWAAATTGREMPRQNGKGDEIEVVELWGLVQRGEAILHTVHDAVMLASQAQQRMLAVLDRPDLKPKKRKVWQGSGQQMIEMKNGGVIWYRTRSGGGGRGIDDVDRLVVDEAQHATEEHLAAVAPTLLANDNPQLNAMGTSGLEGRSEWWWTIRKRALGSDPGKFGYVGHTAERVRLEDGRVVQDPVDVQDRALWWASNPALVRQGERGMEFLEEELLTLGSASFAREHLCVWDPPAEASAAEIDMARWADLDQGREDRRPSPVAFAVEVSQDRQWSTIAMAGLREDGNRHLQVVQSGRGTGWVADRLAELNRAWKPVAVALNPSGPAGSLIPELGERKLEPLLVSRGDLGRATGMVLDGITEGTVRHSSQPVLSIAVGAAQTRKVGDVKVWDLRGSTDVAPLQAVTLALFALVTAKPKKRSGVVRW